MPYLSLGPVTEALKTLWNVTAFTDLAPGGATDDVLQGTTFPYLLFEVREARQLGGMGTKPGDGALPEIDCRLHAFSRSDDTNGMGQPQAVMAKAIELLFGTPPTVTGYTFIGPSSEVFTTPLSDEEVLGIKVRELVTDVRFWCEEA